MNIDNQIQELEKQKAALLKQKKEDEKALKSAHCRLAIGKYFKSCRSDRWRDKIGTSNIQYLYIKDFIRYSDGKIMYDESEGRFVCESFSIRFSPAGWIFKDKQLKIQTGTNGVSIQVRRHFGSPTIEADTDYGHTSFSTEKISEGYISNGYAQYKECTEEEYFEALNFAINEANEFSSKAKKFFEHSYYKPVTAETEGVFKMDYTVIQKYNDLLKFVSDKNVSLDSLVKAGGKVRKYNYFNGSKLEELCQYSLDGEVGLSLSIRGGDDGTDYEPYTTHYYIDSVNLDWLIILYPIRTMLDSVQETAKELYGHKSIYQTNNWDCIYDISSYDATFSYAKLNKRILDEINIIIQKHLK